MTAWASDQYWMLRLYCWNLSIYWASHLDEYDVFFKYCRSLWFIIIVIV